MKKINLTINKDYVGVHARPAGLFVKIASKFPCEIQVIRDEIEVNAKSILGIMMLALGPGAEFSIVANGPQEEEAILALEDLVRNDFQEKKA